MNRLKQPWLTATVLILVLLSTARHNAAVYLRITTDHFPYLWLDWTYAIFIVVALDFAVLLFAIHGEKQIAGVFAFLIFLTNLAYYMPDAQIMDLVRTTNFWLGALIASIFSGMYGYAIYKFSEIFVQDVKERVKAETIPNGRAKFRDMFPGDREAQRIAREWSARDREGLRKLRDYRDKQLRREDLSDIKRTQFAKEIEIIDTLIQQLES